MKSFAGALSVAVLVCACARPAVKVPTGAQPSAAPEPRAAATGVPIQVTSHRVGSKYIYWTKQARNRKVYVLRADSEIGRYSGGNTGRSDFVNPHVIFYGSDGKRLVADAPAGTVVEKDKTVRMDGGVHAKTQDGTTLTSDALRYDDQTEMMHGEGNVVVGFPTGEELRGQSLDWSLRDGSINVTGAR